MGPLHSIADSRKHAPHLRNTGRVPRHHCSDFPLLGAVIYMGFVRPSVRPSSVRPCLSHSLSLSLSLSLSVSLSLSLSLLSLSLSLSESVWVRARACARVREHVSVLVAQSVAVVVVAGGSKSPLKCYL